ncbi:DUF4411 family protein [Eubacteriales bacterium OttesenSCG-928-G02]|nr:DUF4411 family protein [Eubacteriales bacterium OttesenSCG-928-G02]
MSNQTIYLVDANSFITPYKEYYQFDMAKSFWNFLEELIAKEVIVVARKVYDEVLKGTDDLSEWMKQFSLCCIDHRLPEVLENYKKVLGHIQEQTTYYTPKALAEWSDNSKADAWLVAIAMANGYTVITFERPNRSLGTSPSGHPKIPDICAKFGVPCINLFEMMKRLNFKF